MRQSEQNNGCDQEPLLVARGLSKRYRLRGRPGCKPVFVQALDCVSVEIRRGATLALVGESGSGKSTLARSVARLEDTDSGEIWFCGQNISALRGRRLHPIRNKIQMVFQDPATALNPRFSAVEIVAEPLVIQGCSGRESRGRALDLMEQTGLPRSHGSRVPRELSGGQKQRLAIARALALEPRLLILDEPLSGLDLSIQAQLVNLLLELQASRDLSYLYISHDLDMVEHIADEVAVMYQGRIVEKAPTADLFASPRHDYARSLLQSTAVLQSGISELPGS